MIKDKIITGAVVGLLADAVKLTVNYVGYLLNFSPIVFWQIIATRFLDKNELFSPLAYLIGAVTDFTMTAVLGIVFVYFIHFFGSRYLWIKGIGFGLSVWVILFGTLLTTIQNKIQLSATGILLTIVAHSFFGLAIAFFTWLLVTRGESGNGVKPHIYRIKNND